MGTNLKSLRFAAFALGNKQYQHFCAMGRWIDAKATALLNCATNAAEFERALNEICRLHWQRWYAYIRRLGEYMYQASAR